MTAYYVLWAAWHPTAAGIQRNNPAAGPDFNLQDPFPFLPVILDGIDKTWIRFSSGDRTTRTKTEYIFLLGMLEAKINYSVCKHFFFSLPLFVGFICLIEIISL